MGRWGGEKFIAVLPDTDRESALAIAERLRTRIDERAATSSRPRVTVTIGVAVWYGGGAEDLVSSADAALYAGKAAGRHTVQLATFNPKPLPAVPV